MGWDLGNELWVPRGPSPSLSPLPQFLDLLDLLDHSLCLPVCAVTPQSSPAALAYFVQLSLSLLLCKVWLLKNATARGNKAIDWVWVGPLTSSVTHTFQSPISPWWPPVLFMENRQSPKELLALPLDTYLQNTPLPKSPGFWGSMCKADRRPQDSVSHPLHYSPFEGLTVAHKCKLLGLGCGVLFCAWPKGNMTQLLPFAQPAAIVLHICLIYIIIC